MGGGFIQAERQMALHQPLLLTDAMLVAAVSMVPAGILATPCLLAYGLTTQLAGQRQTDRQPSGRAF